jgi:hypothetical protein
VNVYGWATGVRLQAEIGISAFAIAFRQVLGPTQPPIQWDLSSFLGAWSWPHLHLAPLLRLRAAIYTSWFGAQWSTWKPFTFLQYLTAGNPNPHVTKMHKSSCERRVNGVLFRCALFKVPDTLYVRGCSVCGSKPTAEWCDAFSECAWTLRLNCNQITLFIWSLTFAEQVSH